MQKTGKTHEKSRIRNSEEPQKRLQLLSNQRSKFYPSFFFLFLTKSYRSTYQNGNMAIHPRFNKIITSLRAAVENGGVLDKEATSYDDLFDSFRLSLQFWR